MLCTMACNSSQQKATEAEEDAVAKAKLQGTWVNEIEGNIVFYIKGDTVFFNDSTSSPELFYVLNDTFFIRNSSLTSYSIKNLTEHAFTFINTEGDETALTKISEDMTSLARGEHKGTVNINQGHKIKRDTVFNVGEKKYHAYMQINPTTYKVYKQSTNSDGMIVESVYYDNIIHISVFDGGKKLFGRNMTKNDFKEYVPATYLKQAVLADMIIDSANSEKVRFIAILSIPDSYTNYRVNIDVYKDGTKKLSV